MESCACGCGEAVPRKRYPSQQNRYINGHQHRGHHNGNFRGGKQIKPCAVCGTPFPSWPSQTDARTCGKRACYLEWQRLTTAARGQNKATVTCDQCGKTLHRFPSRIKERNFCNRLCMLAGTPWVRGGTENGNWRGGSRRHHQEQAALRDDRRCVICGFDLAYDIHHITARSTGGADHMSNLLTLCPNHHRLAHLGIIDLEHLRRSDSASR